MPRGRAGLDLIPADRVRAAFSRWYTWRSHSPTHIGAIWLVSERTIRRWQKRGLPLFYGNVWITRQEWEAFEQTGKCPRTKPPIAEISKNEKVSAPRTSTRSAAGRTGVDRQVSVAAVKWWPMRGRAR